jgi:hypothetical protein
MSGFINPSYGVVNQTLNISSIRDRKYRGFKRDDKDFYAVRDVFIGQKEAMFAILSNYQASFENPSEFTEAKEYLMSFFEVIENEASFKKNVIDVARTK